MKKRPGLALHFISLSSQWIQPNLVIPNAMADRDNYITDFGRYFS